MGIYVNPGNRGFAEIADADYVDKTMLIEQINRTVGKKDKLKHRAEFGISIEEAYWGFGIGRALTQACIECAREAGYSQLELDVVAENVRAVSLYKSIGFSEYGRNPRGFRSRKTGWQELILMRMEL